MPAYNFQPGFASLIEKGEKRQTIRKKRKRPTRPGDKLYLYTGMRTKKCRLLGRTVCADVQDIIITETGIEMDGKRLSAAECHALAKADGFDDVVTFQAFFRAHYGLPFTGVVIRWFPLGQPIGGYYD